MTDPVKTEVAKAISSALGSPLSEASELIADKIRYLRWKNAVKTLERASEYAAQRQSTLAPPPIKFFLPFMEGCSLEDDTDNLIDEWARLLNATSELPSANHLIFTRILREIGPVEAKVMQEIYSNRSVEEQTVDDVFDAIGHFRDLDPYVFGATFKELFENRIPVEVVLENLPDVERKLRVNLSSRGISVLEFILYNCRPDQMENNLKIWQIDDGLYGTHGEEETLFAVDVLAYHRLVEIHSSRVDLGEFVEGEMSAWVVGVNVTSLGAHFAKACLDSK